MKLKTSDDNWQINKSINQSINQSTINIKHTLKILKNKIRLLYIWGTIFSGQEVFFHPVKILILQRSLIEPIKNQQFDVIDQILQHYVTVHVT